MDKRSKRTRSRSDQSFCSICGVGAGDGQCSGSNSLSDGMTSSDDQRCQTRRNSSGSSNGESWDWSERSLCRPKVSANAAAGGGVTGTDNRVTLFDLPCNGVTGLIYRRIKGVHVMHCIYASHALFKYQTGCRKTSDTNHYPSDDWVCCWW